MKAANPFVAALALFVSPRRYNDMAYADLIASNLEAPDMAAHFAAGTWPTPENVADYRAQVSEHGAALRLFVLTAFLWTAAVFLSALAIAAWHGVVAIDAPLSPSKVLQASGMFLAAWGTIFQLGRTEETMGGASLAERVPGPIFMVLFLPGTLLGVLGAIW